MPKGVAAGAPEVAGIGRQGRNDFEKIGYGGPAPPAGKPHRYFFRLYAVDRKLELPPGAGKQDVVQAIKDRVLAEASLLGKYQR